MKNDQDLTIVVTCADGWVTSFEQTDHEAALKLIRQLEPGRVFSNPFISITGSRYLTAFPSALISRIDLLTGLELDWDFHWGVQDAYEVSLSEFERLAASEIVNARPPTAIIAEMEMQNVPPVHLVLVLSEHPEPMVSVDFEMLLQRFLAAPSFHARRLGGGGMIINAHQVLRFKFYPSPLEPFKGAWYAEPSTLSVIDRQPLRTNRPSYS